MIEKVNEEFGIDGRLVFGPGGGGMPRAVIRTQLSYAELYLHGAHVTGFCPQGGQPVLWLSEAASFRPDKAIRGGIPVCWPWFGPHPSDPTLPQHGFARTSDWTVSGTAELPGGEIEIRLRLRDDENTRKLWPYAFQLQLRVVAGTSLELELLTANTGTEPVEVGGALHTYFLVGDAGEISIDGLDGRRYMDQLDGHRIKETRGTVKVEGEVDRIYLDAADQCLIDDPVLNRWIRMEKSGSNTTVVWNPWEDKSRRMADFPDEGYRSMVCIEATNAADDVRVLRPGQEHTLSQTITEEPF
jgi:glucose-6-phosphate 1-epimerase